MPNSRVASRIIIVIVVTIFVIIVTMTVIIVTLTVIIVTMTGIIATMTVVARSVRETQVGFGACEDLGRSPRPGSGGGHPPAMAARAGGQV